MATRMGAEYLNAAGVATEWMDVRALLRSESTGDSTERSRYLAATCHYEPDDDTAASPARAGEGRPDPGVHREQRGRAHCTTGSRRFRYLGRLYRGSLAGESARNLDRRTGDVQRESPQRALGASATSAFSYNEALEIATSGGKVLHPRCIPPARRYGIPISIHWTAQPEHRGTPDFRFTGGGCAQSEGNFHEDRAHARFHGDHGYVAAGRFSRRRVSGIQTLRHFNRSGVDLRDQCDRLARSRGPTLWSETYWIGLCRIWDPSAGPSLSGACAAVSLVGRHIRAILHELGPALELFEEQRIHLVSQAANDLNFTFVVDQDQAHRLMQQLHNLLIKRLGSDDILGPTWEMLNAPEAGSTVVHEQWWLRKRKKLIGIAESESCAYVYDSETLDHALREIAGIDTVDRVLYAIKANSHAQVLRKVHDAGLGLRVCLAGRGRSGLDAVPRPRQKENIVHAEFRARAMSMSTAWKPEYG